MVKFPDILETTFWMAAGAWRQSKDQIEQSLAVDNLTIHVVAGFALFLLLALPLRQRQKWLVAWAAVFVIALWNEVVDMATEHWPDITQQYAEASIDLVATMAIPTIILAALLVRAQRPAKTVT